MSLAGVNNDTPSTYRCVVYSGQHPAVYVIDVSFKRPEMRAKSIRSVQVITRSSGSTLRNDDVLGRKGCRLHELRVVRWPVEPADFLDDVLRLHGILFDDAANLKHLNAKSDVDDNEFLHGASDADMKIGGEIVRLRASQVRGIAMLVI